jgi:hypothetical protein
MISGQTKSFALGKPVSAFPDHAEISKPAKIDFENVAALQCGMRNP